MEYASTGSDGVHLQRNVGGKDVTTEANEFEFAKKLKQLIESFGD